MGIRVFMEERRNDRRIIQCRRCQQWGHATTNCYKQNRCVRCAGPHATRDCEANTTGGMIVKCANCDGSHQANSTDCPVYKAKIQYLDSRKPQSNTRTAQQKYTIAPTPQENAWQRLRRQVEEDEPTPTPRMARPANSSNTKPQQSSTTGKMDKIGESKALLSELDTLIDIDEMNRALRDLIRELKECDTAESKFQSYYKFIKNLSNNYNI